MNQSSDSSGSSLSLGLRKEFSSLAHVAQCLRLNLCDGELGQNVTSSRMDQIIDDILDWFSPRRRRIVELILEGRPVAEVALRTQASERTVFRTRQAARRLFREGLSK